MKSGNLNFLEPSGPLQACNGTALPFTVQIILKYFIKPPLKFNYPPEKTPIDGRHAVSLKVTIFLGRPKLQMEHHTLILNKILLKNHMCRIFIPSSK